MENQTIVQQAIVEHPKRGRGRPRKNETKTFETFSITFNVSDAGTGQPLMLGEQPVKRGRGRPRKDGASAPPAPPEMIDGRPAGEVLWKNSRKGGGAITWAKLEDVYGLHRSNGMTAYRIAHKWLRENHTLTPIPTE